MVSTFFGAKKVEKETSVADGKAPTHLARRERKTRTRFSLRLVAQTARFLALPSLDASRRFSNATEPCFIRRQKLYYRLRI
ncbi:hypothetical protein A3C37_03450 [Candidatus Peribacteria bacterium RIFCSPHIGHO2_02_FULL_53_20]|nr:MAG: hypothetical protein A3C37_03450 [Candidatus Peribacteria bacterium RIFCSPHIGHO2_02_FULL_53_20]OGJ72649.1 MAG: hypothetical protein A3G69_01885 [Candidatus Peribacteria bacterium RIFCSPLOWO2_12_FULL_53_10]